jgi:gamma-glutamylcyclotransferase (GGCT)/AIG2-like uncharacterized protein YtfP
VNTPDHAAMAPDTVEPRLLFVYGTLRRGSRSLMAERLAGEATFVGEGTVSGRLFDTGAYPACIPTADPSERVHGEVFALRAETRDDLLAVLDQYEGYAADARYSSLFVRERTVVRFADGSEEVAWIYHYNEGLDDAIPITTGDWLVRDA